MTNSTNASSFIKKSDPKIYDILQKEISREDLTLELIASENFVSYSILEMAGGVMTNKYAEGYPGARYYGGCEHVDEAENLARDRAKKLFDCEYVNVQPHSGSQANMAVLMTFLNVGDTIMGLDLAHGGHLTHGSHVNFSGKLYNSVSYQVDKDTGRVDFNSVRSIAKEFKPQLIICGGSAYPRHVEFEQFREVADEVGAFLMADIAHPSGLVAAGLHPSPMNYCDIVTSTTHKTLRGPRGGMIMMGKDIENKWKIVAPKSGRTKMVSELLDSSVMPGIQGGPLMHIIAAKAIAFNEALQPEFKIYAQQVIDNAKAMSETLLSKGYNLISGGTDTHVVLIDLSNKDVTGKLAEKTLEKAG
ncbi:MAG: serine hydroxymethyltransferase, partial [Fidelibacterota bacterium]